MGVLQGTLRTYQDKLEEKDREIEELKKYPPGPAPSNSCGYMMGMVAVVVGVVTLAYIFLWKTGPKVSPI